MAHRAAAPLRLLAFAAAAVRAVADEIARSDDDIVIAPRNPTKEAVVAYTTFPEGSLGEELRILLSNFLLYVTLVIATAGLQHYYFPDSIAAGEAAAAAPAPAPATDDADESEAPLVDVGEPPRLGPRKSSSSALAQLFDDSPFAQENASKKEVLTRLVLYASGLLVSFVIWGLLQERILTKPYAGDYFTSSYGLVFLNRLGGFLISGAMLYLFDPPASNAIVYRFAFPSVSNMLSSWCQYEALKYVSFPTQMLFKCFKLFPIMLMGRLLGTKSYPLYDYAVAAAIGVGIAVFSVSTEDMEIGQDAIGEVEAVGGTVCGIVLLLFFLVFDSFTGQYQARLFNEHPDLSPYRMMFLVNTFSTVFSFITLVHGKELQPACTFVYEHAEMHIHLVIFSLCSTVGQLFIFKTIKAFGPVVFAICMNTRIILSILLSAFVYSHEITFQGALGLAIVFSAIAYRIKRKVGGRQLVKWAEMTDSKSMDIFHEWHEHCDM